MKQAFPNIQDRASRRPNATYNLAVNGISLGMNADDALPIAPEVIEQSAIVAECVVAPEITPLLDIAIEKGRTIHTGVPMLTAQIDLLIDYMNVI